MRPGFFCVLVFLLLGSASADMIVYGDSVLNGSPVPVGSVVSARVGDLEVGNYTVRESGSYGLLIEFNGSLGSPVEFYCDDFRAVQVLPFEDKGIVALDLDFRVKETSTTTSTSFAAPGVVGNAISVTVSDNVLALCVFVLLAIIFSSIRDLLS